MAQTHGSEVPPHSFRDGESKTQTGEWAAQRTEAMDYVPIEYSVLLVLGPELYSSPYALNCSVVH